MFTLSAAGVGIHPEGVCIVLAITIVAIAAIGRIIRVS
jgi:Na+-transporting methylmalonyl-CoA/oxaloacetate decarboxylase gamma subunit